MLLARKGNRELNILPEAVEKYKDMHYSIYEDGKPIFVYEADSTKLVKALKENEALKEENSVLKKEIEDLKKNVDPKKK